jgi:cytochrome c
MSSDTFNWLAMAALSALLLIFGTPVLINVLRGGGGHGGHGGEHAEAGYKLPVEVASADTSGASGGEAAAPQDFEVANVYAKFSETSADAGERIFKQCQSCHTANKGGKNAIGPNLWEVVGREKASHEGFKYSNAMVEKGGSWDYDALAHFVHDPKGWLSGTKMSFRGLKKEEDVAAMLLYLRSLSDNPKPLPEAASN